MLGVGSLSCVSALWSPAEPALWGSSEAAGGLRERQRRRQTDEHRQQAEGGPSSDPAPTAEGKPRGPKRTPNAELHCQPAACWFLVIKMRTALRGEKNKVREEAPDWWDKFPERLKWSELPQQVFDVCKDMWGFLSSSTDWKRAATTK